MITLAVFDKARKGKIMEFISSVILISRVCAHACAHDVHTQTDGILIVRRDAVTSGLSWRDPASEGAARSTHPRGADKAIISLLNSHLDWESQAVQTNKTI